MKNSLDAPNCKVDIAEENISEFEFENKMKHSEKRKLKSLVEHH